MSASVHDGGFALPVHLGNECGPGPRPACRVQDLAAASDRALGARTVVGRLAREEVVDGVDICCLTEAG